MDGVAEVPPDVQQPSGEVASTRFNVYRNNVVTSLVDAMVVGFPAVHCLLGDEYFRALAAVFVKEHPPETPILANYGEFFPSFCQSFEPLKAYPYLSDVAALELARRRSCNAVDQCVRGADQLPLLDPDALMQVVPVPHASLQIVHSKWPVHELWISQQNAGTTTKPNMSLGAQSVLLLRPKLQVEQYLLSAEESSFVEALDGQLGLADIAANILAHYPETDFVQLIVLMVQRGTIAEFIVPEEA